MRCVRIIQKYEFADNVRNGRGLSLFWVDIKGKLNKTEREHNDHVTRV